MIFEIVKSFVDSNCCIFVPNLLLFYLMKLFAQCFVVSKDIEQITL